MRHYRTDLNNIVQKYRLRMKYEEHCDGPQHEPTWTVCVYIGEIPYGRHSARSQGGAREGAAKLAVEALEEAGYYI
ncbi:hypothetical protein Hypma_006135 [Hypsizygus marmoreus]|uniref:DRBM domain-containing protein n=1 Tax=Hypsizygus marmoreus TaxID=39966 RepID=A0A369K0D4_HYPMA|nr:hypothetical protein Hypma_006135 [Hypsizygus marmoreus]